MLWFGHSPCVGFLRQWQIAKSAFRSNVAVGLLGFRRTPFLTLTSWSNILIVRREYICIHPLDLPLCSSIRQSRIWPFRRVPVRQPFSFRTAKQNNTPPYLFRQTRQTAWKLMNIEHGRKVMRTDPPIEMITSHQRWTGIARIVGQRIS